MTAFKTSLRIIAGHWWYVLIYLVLMSQLGLLTGLSTSSRDAASLMEEKADVAVIDRDGSQVSQAIAHYAESSGAPIDLADDRRAMQDAIAQGRAEYILIIPAGYGRAFASSAAAGAPAPAVEAAIVAISGDGPLMDQRVNAYLNSLYDYLSAGTMTTQEAISRAQESTALTARAELLVNEAEAIPQSLVTYATMSTYPLLAFATVSIATLMTSLNRRPVRSRLLASPQRPAGRNLGLLAACITIGVVGWAWIAGVGLVFFALPSLPAAAPLVGVIGTALLAYTMVGVSIGFLLGSLGVSETWANTIANIGGMVLSFISGAWLPSQLLPEAIVTISRVTPGYWATSAIHDAYEAVSTEAWDVTGMLADCGLCALFAIAIACVALMVGRARQSAGL